MTVRPFDFAGRWRAAQAGAGVALVPDERWARPDIKSISLLPNVLAKEAARREGAFEAWFVDRDGLVTEGSSTNAWIVTGAGRVVTRPRGPILAGVMRATLLRLAGEEVAIEERAFTPDEARGAAEAFLTSTTNPCLPVTAIDGAPVGDGRPGPVTGRLRDRVWAEIGRQTGWRPPV
jgi:D-alanine transaminase